MSLPSLRSSLTTAPHWSRAITSTWLITVRARRTGWGKLPGLYAVGAFALVLISQAATGARNSEPWAEPLFWAGLLVLFVPIATRLLMDETSRQERIGLVLMLGFGLYVIKLIHSPLSLTFADELMHWRSTSDVLQGHHLFKANSLLTISPLYPGLESTTSALVNMTGLDIFTAGIILIAVARLVLVLALFLLYEGVSGSARVGGIALLIFMSNPSFLFFDAQFSYESLALAFAAIVLFALARRMWTPSSRQTALRVTLLLMLCSTTITHHLTSYALVGFLGLFTFASFLSHRSERDHLTPLWTLLIALVASLIWVLYVAKITVTYLTADLISSVQHLIDVFLMEASSRELYSGAGQVPVWEPLVGYTTALVIIGGLAIGLVYGWRRYQTRTVTLGFTAAALVYPITQLLRFVDRGPEIAGRISPFLFIALAFILATAVTGLWPLGVNWKRYALLIGAVTVVFLGGVVVSFPRWARLPGPYLVAADTRSMDFQSITAAEWARDFLGQDNRISTDRVNGLLMGSYGQQFQVTKSYDWIDLPRVFFAADFGATELDLLRQGRVRYVIVDRRLSQSLPTLGFYYEPGEVNKTPINPRSLAKFDEVQRIHRVYDDGQIVIYDVGLLTETP